MMGQNIRIKLLRIVSLLPAESLWCAVYSKISESRLFQFRAFKISTISLQSFSPIWDPAAKSWLPVSLPCLPLIVFPLLESLSWVYPVICILMVYFSSCLYLKLEIKVYLLTSFNLGLKAEVSVLSILFAFLVTSSVLIYLLCTNTSQNLVPHTRTQWWTERIWPNNQMNK